MAATAIPLGRENPGVAVNTASFRSAFETVTIGGLQIAVLSRAETADLMVRAAIERPRGQRPLYLTSANGEVIARVNSDGRVARLFEQADQIVADGQPMVMASRRFCRRPLPERVATTDLFHDVARRAERLGLSFYMFGATEAENQKAVQAVRRAYPNLRIAGHCHGFLTGEALDVRLNEINAARPDVLWLAMGVPREQEFVARYADQLTEVGMIKTSGGLFNFLSGANRRAPGWMQAAGLEWAWRVMMEPRRLFWRYVVTNPVAIYQMVRRSS